MKKDVIKRIVTVVLACLMLLLVVGCGGSNNSSSNASGTKVTKKEGVLGSSLAEIKKVHGQGKDIAGKNAGVEYDKVLVFFDAVDQAKSICEKKASLDSKDLVTITKFLPADAKEMTLSKDEAPDYLKGKHRFFYSKTLADKIPVQKYNGKELKFNIIMSPDSEGNINTEWWYDSSSSQYKELVAKAPKKPSKNNQAKAKPASQGIQKVTCEQLLDTKMLYMNYPTTPRYEGKMVEVSGQIRDKFIENGHKYVVLYQYTKTSGAIYYNKYFYVLLNDTSSGYFQGTILLEFKDVQIFNQIMVGSAANVRGLCNYNFSKELFNINWTSYDDDDLRREKPKMTSEDILKVRSNNIPRFVYVIIQVDAIEM